MKPTPEMIEAAVADISAELAGFHEIGRKTEMTLGKLVERALTVALALVPPPEVTEEAIDAAVNAYHDDIRTSMRAAIEAADRVRFARKPKVRQIWTVVWIDRLGEPHSTTHGSEEMAQKKLRQLCGGQVLGPASFPESKG